MFGMGGNFDRNTTFQTCWSNLPFGFKTFFVSGLLISVLQILVGAISYFLVSLPILTIYSFQIWRIFLSMYLSLGLNGVFNFLIIFLWFLDIWPNMQKKYSSIFMIVDVILHNACVQTLFTLIVGIYGLVFRGQITALYSGGWGIILLIYLFKESAINPQQNIKFCCFPCLIPRKYIPWIMLAFGLIFSSAGGIICYLCAAFIGYTQAYYLKTNFFRLPLGFYAKLDNILPKAITKRSDYIMINKVRESVKPLTYQCCAGQQTQETGNVDIIGGGVRIGGNIPANAVNIREINIKRFQQKQPPEVQPQINFDQDLYRAPIPPKKQGKNGSLLDQNDDSLQDETRLSDNGLIKSKDMIQHK